MDYDEYLKDSDEEDMDSVSLSNYEANYTEGGLWTKIRKHYKRAGRKIVEMVLTLYYSMQDADTPMWCKPVILGALGYFILPLDILPDFIPVAGLTDDIAAISAALATVALHIKEEHKDKAKDKTRSIFK